MTISDWVLVGSVVVALVIGIIALRQTKNLEKRRLECEEEIRQREHRQRMLNEVIDWATEMSNLSYTGEALSLFERKGIESVYIGILIDIGRLSQLLARAKPKN